MRNTPLRRAALVAAGALLGLTGLVGLASPASATETTPPLPGCVKAADAPLTVSGWSAGKADAVVEYKGPAPLCDTLVVQMLTYTAKSATFDLPQYLFDHKLQQIEKDATSGSVAFTDVKVPDCYAQVDLVRGADVINPLKSNDNLYGDRKIKWWNGGGGACSPNPVATPVTECDGSAKINLVNPKTITEAKFEITADGGFSQTVTIEPNEFGTVEIPAANAKNIVVKANGKEIYNGTPEGREDCPQPEPTPGVLTSASTCDELTFKVSNPGDGKAVTVTFTPSEGNGEAKTVTVNAGDTADVAFPAKENLAVTVTGDITASNGVVIWTKPADCESAPEPSTPASEEPSTPASEEPSASPSASTPAEATPSESASTSSTPIATTPVSDDEPSLPVTGAAAGGIAGGAAVLVAVGAGLFFMARRRKLNFKA